MTELDQDVSDDSTIPENWDYYITEVDELPASIAVDLSLHEHLEKLESSTLYVVRIHMHDVGSDATGAPGEAELLHAVEKAIVFEAWQHHLRYIGRVRNNGRWEISFMGQASVGWQLELIAESHLQMLGREFSVSERADPQWSFYRSFLYPDTEQLQWMKDRRVTDALMLHGDTLTTPRRIDHVISFDDPRSRDAFRLQVEAQGFGSTRGLGFSLQVFRTDSVRLEDVHELSQFLSELAAEYTGAYQGWKTRLVRTPSHPASAAVHRISRSLSSLYLMVRDRAQDARVSLGETLFKFGPSTVTPEGVHQDAARHAHSGDERGGGESAPRLRMLWLGLIRRVRLRT